MKVEDKELKEFWEWCGWHEEYFDDEPDTVWAIFRPDGTMSVEGYPELTLDNLFQDALPKIFGVDGYGQGGVEFRQYPGGVECFITYEVEAGMETETSGFLHHFDHTQALYKAIREVMNNERE